MATSENGVPLTAPGCTYDAENGILWIPSEGVADFTHYALRTWAGENLRSVSAETMAKYRAFLTVVRSQVQSGGSDAKTRAAHVWVSTGRTVTLRDGSKRSLYKNAAKPGDLRVRRMAVRAGKSVATYVKPPR